VPLLIRLRKLLYWLLDLDLRSEKTLFMEFGGHFLIIESLPTARENVPGE